jgi:parvulin-like peptidyl-prolyl isomerase
MKINPFSQVVSLMVIGLFISVTASTTNEDTPLARVNDNGITVAELKAKLKEQGVQDSDTLNAQMVISQALNSIIVDRIVAEQAASYDFSDDTSFQKDIDEHMMRQAFQTMYDRYVTVLVSVTPEEVEIHYSDNQETKYKIAEQVGVSHILIEPQQDPTITDAETRRKQAAQSAKEKAQEILKRAQREDFANLAETFSSDHSTSHRGGDLGYRKRGQLLPEFDSAVFAAQPGDVIGPLESQHGYHILKVFEKIQEGYQLLDEQLKNRIRDELIKQKTIERNQMFLDSLRNAATYEFNDSVLSLADTARFEGGLWGIIVNGTDTVTAEQVQEELQQYRGYTQGGQLSLDEKKEFFRTKSAWAQFAILENLAKGLGLLNGPEAEQERKRFAQQRAEQIIRQEAVSSYKPSQEEIGEYFESHSELYTAVYPLRVYHIIFDDSLTAEAVRDTILEGADFVEMARKFYLGEGEMSEMAYDLGHISEYEMPEGFYQEADKLKEGEVSPPFKTFLGYHLIKLVERKKDKTLKEVTPKITEILQEEQRKKARAEWEAKLKKQAKIRIYQETIKDLELDRLLSG